MKRNGNAKRRRRENRGAEGAERVGSGEEVGSGEGVSPSPVWEGAPSPEFFFDFFCLAVVPLVHSGRLF